MKQGTATDLYALDWVAPYVGAWIETLSISVSVSMARSHPTWVRGLKRSTLRWLIILIKVAPYVGAWIEIR